MHLYDRIYFQQELRYPGDFHWGSGLPSLTAFESADELARLQTFGFFCSEPDINLRDSALIR